MSHLIGFQLINERGTIISRPVQKNTQPRLSVVGAGIGDPEHITLKAVRALQSADAVLYDALVNEELLNYAPPGAAKVYVGKRRGEKAFTQEEINERIVAYAHCCGHVVRLKGGDPFVFGRGLEEMQYAQSQGIPAEYIPGVSSSIAGAGAAGIAVTARGASRGFWVLTATTDTGDLNPEIFSAAATDATIVILMGVAKITDIALAFMAAGKTDLPVAIIQNATLPTQREMFGTVADISEKVQESGIGSPAVIVIGEVVRHRIQGDNIDFPSFENLESLEFKTR
ncbi:MAG: uroporphyrinogen-III C-methyltransferase [Saprospiraceae bacterium]|nr:uroporphyrinogen-III C-methyltransferase [Saprospiraceae bacterium]